MRLQLLVQGEQHVAIHEVSQQEQQHCEETETRQGVRLQVSRKFWNGREGLSHIHPFILCCPLSLCVTTCLCHLSSNINDMAYLPADIRATLSALQGHLDALQAPIAQLIATSSAVSGLEKAKADLALAYFQYVMFYLHSRMDGDDSCYPQVKEGLGQVQACADLLQAALTSPVQTSK